MIYPTNNHILVQEVAKEETTSSGLILSADIETGSKAGYVAAVGPKCDQTLLNQTIYLQWGKGMAVTDDGKMGVLISDEHVMGIKG